jgi:hypothetical protein
MMRDGLTAEQAQYDNAGSQRDGGGRHAEAPGPQWTGGGSVTSW